MKKLLLITHNQFGYQTDFFKYACYLRQKYDINYLCLDQKKTKIEMDRVQVGYVNPSSRKLILLFSFIFEIRKMIFNNNPEVIIVKYFPLCSLIPLILNRKHTILSIQTASVTKNSLNNVINDLLIYIAYLSFKSTAVVSESLRARLHLNRAKILPVGADIIIDQVKLFSGVKLLYVGTLNNRDIDKTIIGTKMFSTKHPNIKIIYTIVGDGSIAQIEKIKKLIEKNNLSGNVNYLGYLDEKELQAVLRKHNIGVSFIPITKYYDKQPPTKTYEYLMSGMPVIATNTYEHRKLINESSGILISDSAVAFCEGIEKIIKNKDKYNSSEIRKMYSRFTWANIIEKDLQPLINDIICKNEKT